ncbi:MAG: hypothetical protein ACLSFO_01515 [Anaerovoracaceae bacterium]
MRCSSEFFAEPLISYTIPDIAQLESFFADELVTRTRSPHGVTAMYSVPAAMIST